MSSALELTAIAPGAPGASDHAIYSQGTTASAALDIYEELGIAAATGDPVTGKLVILVSCETNDAGIIFGDASVAAPLLAATNASNPTQRCARIVPDAPPRVFRVDPNRRYFRVVGGAASTRIEITRA